MKEMKLNNKTILLTGAGGFIGSHLASALVSAGAKVKALLRYNSRSDQGFLPTHSGITTFFGDVRDKGFVEEAVKNCDLVFHLAALIGIPYSYHAPQSYIDTNVTGTLNILEACRKVSPEKIILTSTSEVYGSALTTPMNEAHPLQAQSPYSASKISADMIATAYSRSFGLPVTIVRPFNTYGPRQSMRAVIPTIAFQALTSKIIKLGSTTPIRDFNYVSDTVNGFIAAAKHGKTDASIYNLATGKGYRIQQVADLIIKLTDSKAILSFEEKRKRPDASEVSQLIGDAGKANLELGWKPLTNIETGLLHTIEWIKNNLVNFQYPEKFII
jgi:dTDP-glucose 4,6-dehydratase